MILMLAENKARAAHDVTDPRRPDERIIEVVDLDADTAAVRQRAMEAALGRSRAG